MKGNAAERFQSNTVSTAPRAPHRAAVDFRLACGRFGAVIFTEGRIRSDSNF